MIKTYFAGEVIPENEKYAYVIARDGCFIIKKNGIFESCTKIDGIPDLEEQKERFVLKAKKIPYGLIKKVLAFFFAVYQKHKSEAMVLLSYEKGKWLVYVPEQSVGGCSVKYKNGKHGIVGSIHSHPGFGCGASGIDDKDEADFDGIHIIISRFEEVMPELGCYVVVNGRRFGVEPDMIIEDMPTAEEQVPGEWLKKVKPLLETPLIGTGQLEIKKEITKPIVVDEWPCERCLHEPVCYQDVMEADNTCQFFEFDEKRAIYRQEIEEDKKLGKAVV